MGYMTLVSAAGALAALILTFMLPESIVKMGIKDKDLQVTSYEH